jgi:hypothetical protein
MMQGVVAQCLFFREADSFNKPVNPTPIPLRFIGAAYGCR